MRQLFANHVICFKAQAGSEALPVTFRDSVDPLESKTTHIFRPKDVSNQGGNQILKPQSLGTVYAGNYQKVIANKRASLVWEAWIW